MCHIRRFSSSGFLQWEVLRLNKMSISVLLHVLLPLVFTLTAVYSKTLAPDIEVLRSIKESIDPNSISPASFLNTWNFAIDPCETTGTHFLGILCTIPEGNASSRILEIDLEGDGLEGFLTPIIGNLSELTTLNLRKNKFRGPLPATIINLRKITSLLLSENFFSGSIPIGFSNLKRLEVLDLSQNRLSGAIPAVITGFRSLTHLSLSNNEFSGRVPDLAGLWQLNTLDLGSNQLIGNLPTVPSNIKTLLLGHNLLSGHISSVSRLKHLRVLDLSDNRFSGSIDQRIFTLPEVKHINISVNHFTTIEVAKLSNRPSQLESVDAESNRLRGHLPLNFVTYQNLTSLNLGRNLLYGHIPAEYGQRLGRSWRSLYLDFNFLEGPLPSGFNNTVNLKGSLAHNCLNCPGRLMWCHGGQRPASECVGQIGY